MDVSVAVFYIMVTRIINEIEIDIEETLSNEMYFTQDFIDSINDFDGGMDKIKDGIFSWNGKKEYMPLSMMWEITNSCSFSCPFCYINTPGAKRYPFYTLDELKRITDTLVEMGMLFCTVSGGECLLQPDFVEFYRYLKKSGVIVSVFTNGFLINDEIIKAFEEYNPYKVEVSIYGISDEGFKNTTKTSYNYRTVLDNILRLKEIGVDVRCKTPITKLTSSEIPQIKKWCEDNDIFYYVSDELFDSYYGEKVDDYRTDDAVYQTAIEERELQYKKNADNKFGRKIAWNCSAGKYSGVIAGNKSFYPCMSAIGIEKYRYSLSNGVDSAISRFKETLSREKGKNLDFCRGCNCCNICDKCVLTEIKESEQQISVHCREMERFI